jgi:ribosomal protein S18 acetylase RimI-like enzyme
VSIVYRPYKNYDTPAVVALWNVALTGRGCCKSIKPFFLELQWFCKPWFDPQALTLALDDERAPGQQLIGAVLSGFGGGPDQCSVDHKLGVVSMLLVHPDYRQKGVGKELLVRAEQYLFELGTTDARFGCNWERFPYCWGMLGSISPAGVLKSMEGADQFIQTQGYVSREQYEVHGRTMNQAIPWGDPRFAHLRRKFELRIGPRKVTSWLDEALQGGLETTVFELLETAIDRPVAEVRAAEMTQFMGQAQPPQAGLYGLTVLPELRRQGLGKFLMAQTLQHLNDQMFQNVETVIPVENTEARSLLKGMGFAKIDEGTSYAKDLAAAVR